MPPLIIRDWQPADDVAAITKLLHAAYAGLAESGLRFLASHQDEAMTRRRLESGRAFVATIDNRIISTLTLYGQGPNSRCEVYRRPGTYRLGQLAVHPDAQGLWIGAKMIAHAAARARDLGAIALALDTAEPALRLQRWYTRLGFEFVQFISWDVTNYRSVVMVKPLTRRAVSAHALLPADNLPPITTPLTSLRPATIADLERLYEIHRSALKTYVEQTWGPWDEAWQAAFFREHFTTARCRVIHHDGVDVGFLDIIEMTDHTLLVNIEIAPEWQGRGLGTQFIRGIILGATARGVPVRLQVLKVNRRALQLYRRLGFLDHGETQTHIQMERPFVT